MMPRSFLVKKKPGTCAAWQWKEPEQLQWKQDNAVGKSILLFFCFVTAICSCVFVYVSVCTFLLNSSFCLLLPESQSNAKENKTAETVTPNQAANIPGCQTLAMPLLGLGGGPGSETRSKFTLWDPYRMSTLALVTRVKVRLDFLSYLQCNMLPLLQLD